MGIRSRIGDAMHSVPGLRSPIMLDTPAHQKQHVRGFLASHGYTDVRFGASGNRGLFGMFRYLDVFPQKRNEYWSIHDLLDQSGYSFRFIGGFKQ